MNQAILFSDNEVYNVDLQQVEFQAQCQGALITCVISVKELYNLNGQQTLIQTVIDKSEILDLFESMRFDIEDLAEQMIEDELYHSDGIVYLKKLNDHLKSS